MKNHFVEPTHLEIAPNAKFNMVKETLRTFSYAYGHTSKKPSINKSNYLSFKGKPNQYRTIEYGVFFSKHSTERKQLDQTRT